MIVEASDLIFDLIASSVLTPRSICRPPCRSRPRLIFAPFSVCSSDGSESPTPKIMATIKIISLKFINAAF
ncbi:hypothetical protein D3C81_2059800 [compost metagenome]